MEFGIFGSKMASEVVKTQIEAKKAKFVRILERIKRGEKVTLSPRKEEVEWAIRIYNMILRDPIKVDVRKIHNMLAGLPNSIGGEIVIPSKEVAVHLEVAASYRDYKDILPEGAHTTIFPVKVIKAQGVWVDYIVDRVINKAPKGEKRKLGTYIYCVGRSHSLGGKVIPCSFRDGVVDVQDVPRFRCKECNTALMNERRKATRKSKGIFSDKEVDDILADIIG